MEIEQLRKELNHLLGNIVEHSGSYSDNRPIPSLEISFVLAKVNKLKETLVVLKYLLEKQEKQGKKANLSTAELKPVEQIIENEKTIIVEQKVIASKKPIITIKDQLKQQPIKKLMGAFSLNDRYLFANELFKKDMVLFNETVKTIDSCKNLIEAQEILHQSKTTLNWDAENEWVISFFELVERRFLRILS